MPLVKFEYRPIDRWPGELTRGRKTSKFSAGYNDTLKLLTTELSKIGGRSVVLMLAIEASDFKRDGQLRAGTTPSHPGIILSFDSNNGPIRMACDRFSLWRDNLRAVALSLQALRTVDRYGCTKKGEQYRGWSALPPPSADTSPTNVVSVLEARAIIAAILGRKAEELQWDAENAGKLIRGALFASHPDHGGTPEAFKRVCAAKGVLERT